MKSGGYREITTKLVAKWIETEEYIALTVLSKACKFNLFIKTGKGSKTCYKLSESAHNNYEWSLMSNNGDITKACIAVVNHATSTPVNEVKTITTSTGRKLTKVISSTKVDVESQKAVDSILKIVAQNKDLIAENELLREEVERLKKFEDYYKTVKEIKLC